MPTYEYVCKECGQHLEIVQSFDEPSLTTCPSCQGRLRKVFGSIGISFKGSGFYKTDSRGHGTSRSSGEPSAPAAANGDGSGASSAPKEAGPKPSGDAGATPAATGGEKAGKKEQAAPAASKSTAAKAS